MSWDWFRFYANRISWKGSIAVGPVISKNLSWHKRERELPFFLHISLWMDKQSQHKFKYSSKVKRWKEASRERGYSYCYERYNKFILYCYITFRDNNIDICTWINMYIYLYFISTKYYRDNISLLCKSFTTPRT